MGLENLTRWAEVGETGDVSDAMLGEFAARALGQAGNSTEVARSFGARPAIALVFVPAAAVCREPRVTEVIAADAATVDCQGSSRQSSGSSASRRSTARKRMTRPRTTSARHLLEVFVERVEVVREILDYGAGPGILALAPFQGRTIVVAGQIAASASTTKRSERP